MTPLAPGAHPSTEEVDALLDLPGERPADVGGRSVASHVIGCAHCQGVADSLRDVRRLLREESLRTPPAPADLGDRLDTALARAAAGRAGTVVPMPQQARTPAGRGLRAVPRWLSAAAIVAVLGGSAVAATQLSVRQESSVTAAQGSAGADAEARSSAAQATGTDYRRADLGAQVGALLAGAGAVTDLSATSGQAEQAPGAAAAAPAGELLSDPAGLQGCLDAIGSTGQVPLAVDLATFEGEPAAVIVLPGDAQADGTDRVQVWVVARDCRPGADGLKDYRQVDAAP